MHHQPSTKCFCCVEMLNSNFLKENYSVKIKLTLLIQNTHFWLIELESSIEIGVEIFLTHTWKVNPILATYYIIHSTISS